MKKQQLITGSLAMMFLFAGCATWGNRPVPPCSAAVVDGNNVRLIDNILQPSQAAEIQVSFKWETPGDAGCHKYHWEIYKEEKLFFKGQNQPYALRSMPFHNFCYEFKTSPVVFKESVNLPKRGNYRYVLFVDDSETLSIPLKVMNKNYTLHTINAEKTGSGMVTRESGERLGDFETWEECNSALSKAAQGAPKGSRLNCTRIGQDGLMVLPGR